MRETRKVWSRVAGSPVVALAGAAALIAGVLLGGAAPAAAAAGTAPSCIARIADEQPHGLIVWVRNGCGKTMRVKVIMDWARDTPCTTLANGASREWTYTIGSYNRTVLC
ncbi:MAG: beta-Ig-H3/fasciclin [Nonomuraea sp.]|nr:beta-Ig-H3/fasciclin [Nonomuraea sp.]NUP82381.1 beta-Ig-H3/fasciclin [Nonomuraea sp.]NUS09306.1 beta-Ig-H3/fasciclin [Nonomuraea sp.]NUT41492.1 beta-Ig-H3/fasciclin [Thermoactinospora sp.]